MNDVEIIENTGDTMKEIKMNSSMLSASYIGRHPTGHNRPNPLDGKSEENKTTRRNQQHSAQEADGKETNGRIVNGYPSLDKNDDVYFNNEALNQPYYSEIESIFIGQPSWVKGKSMFGTDSYRSYSIKSKWNNKDKSEVIVNRRYRHFEWFRENLLKKYEQCALPVLPDKSLYEKTAGDDSDFVKERRRKLEHFFTLIMSHPILGKCNEVREFLTEKDSVYDHNWKQEMDEKNAVHGSSLVEKASNSFKFLYNTVKEYDYGKLISKWTGATDNSDEEETNIKVNKIEQELLHLKENFDKLFKSISEFAQIRFKEAQVENQFAKLFENRDEFTDVHVVGMLESLSTISNKHHDYCIDNKNQIENELIYETESHLTWIETVIDILHRRKELKNRFEETKKKIKNENDGNAQYEYANENAKLEQRIEKMTEGIYEERKLLKEGTKTFLKVKLHNQFILNQDKFNKNVLKIYEEHTEQHDEFNEEIDRRLEVTFGRKRCESGTQGSPNMPHQQPGFNNGDYHDDYDDDVEELDDDE